ncbi:MAG TPA: hypothetical protein VGE07_05305 [Herpetosiphonaceae bacterium]
MAAALLVAQQAAETPTWALVLALLAGNLVGVGLLWWRRRRRR